MFSFTQDMLKALSIGATFLGAGGGGNPKVLYDLVHFQFENNNAVKILTVDELTEDHIVVPIAFVGAPLVFLEKTPNMEMFDTLILQLQKMFPNKKMVLMPAEIGGCNALTPFLIAGKYQLPILDADIIGRAFPELDMCKPMVLNCSHDPTLLVDTAGNLFVFHLKEKNKLEAMVRTMVGQCGLVSLIVTFICDGEKAKHQVIPGSISRAIQLGEAWLIHHSAPDNFFKLANAKCLATGMIDDIFYDLSQGFVNGYATITSAQGLIKIYYQNEFLLVKQADKVLAGSPEIITVIDAKTGILITAESLAYGINVLVIAIKAPDFWEMDAAKPVVDYKNIYSQELL